jgi:choline kinase
MNCIILADKFDRGMKSRGCCGLVPVSNTKVLIQDQYNKLKKVFPECKIIYIYGHESKKIEHFYKTSNLDIVLTKNDIYNTRGYGYSLFLAEKYIKDNCLILSGSRKFSTEILKTIDHNSSQIFTNKKIKYKLGCHVIKENQAKQICYDAENYISDLYYINEKDVDILKHLVKDSNNYNNFVFEIINKMINHGVNFQIKNINSKNKFNKIFTR